MDQKEKSRISREKILAAAVREFGLNGYEAASLNTICSEYGIAKGLIYHHFKNKEELYLLCLGQCFDSLVAHIEGNSGSGGDLRKNLQDYFSARFAFFKKEPFYANIFFEAMMNPPKALTKEIAGIREPFEQLNLRRFREILESARLRPGISFEDALSYFCIYQEMVNGYFKSLMSGDGGESLLKLQEEKLPMLMDMMIYGIVKEEM